MRGLSAFTVLFVPLLLGAKPPKALIDTPLRYQEQKKIYDTQQERQKAKAPYYTQTRMLPEPSDTNRSSVCVDIKHIVLDDNTLLDEEELATLFKPYIDRCDTMEDISRLVRRINNLYIAESYVTSRAYIKAQDLSQGILHISTMEGKIEKTIEHNVRTGLIVGDLNESVFRLRDIETYMEQLNGLSSKTVTLDVEPGTKVGYSVLVFKGEDTAFPLNGYIGTDNFSYGDFDKFQINGALTWENPLGFQDRLNVNLNMTNKLERGNRSVGSGFSYGLPVNRSYIEAGFFLFEYGNTIEGQSKRYLSEGESLEYYLKVDYRLFHTRHQRGSVALSYTHKKNENYLENVLLDTTSNRFDVVEISYRHEWFFPSWSLFATIGYQQSFNGRYVNEEETDADDLFFHKVIFGLNASVTLLDGSVPLTFTSSLYGQYGSETMVASEQIGIGGPYSVRGFENKDQLSSSTGFYIRNELGTAFRFSRVTVQPYLGLDYGWAEENDYSYGGYIAGYAAGVRLEMYGFRLDVFRSEPIEDSTEVRYLENGDRVVKPLGGFTGISLSYRF